MYSAHDIANLLHTEPTTRDRIGEPYPFRVGKRREITSEWVVGPGNTSPDDNRFGDDDDGTILLTMTSYHYGDRKTLSTNLRVEIEVGNMRQTTMAFGAHGEAVRVSNERCDRFSAKAMREHHARCIELVRYSALNCGQTLEQGVAQYLPKAVA